MIELGDNMTLIFIAIIIGVVYIIKKFIDD